MEHTLDSTTWGKSTQILLQSAKLLNPDLPTLLMLRHSGREEPPRMEDVLNAPLTDSGRQGAEEFGLRLPDTWKYTIYSSPVGRCVETASLIQKGLTTNHNEVQNKGIMANLHEIRLDRIPFVEILSVEGENFLKKWIEEQYPTHLVEPAIDVAKRSAKEIISQMSNSDRHTLSTYVSHDFHVILFLYYWGGIDVMTEWIPYLNGFFLQFAESSLIFILN